MRTATTLVSLSLALLFAGCASEVTETSPLPPAPGEATAAITRSRLQTPQTLDLSLDSELVVQARFPRSGAPYAPVDLDVAGGQIEVAAAGDLLRVDALRLDVGDVYLESIDVTLSDVRVSLAEPVSAEAVWIDELDEGHVELELDVVVEWAGRIGEGDDHALEPIRIEDIRVSLAVRQLPDGLDLELFGASSGQFFDWAGLAQMSDVSLRLHAAEQGLR